MFSTSRMARAKPHKKKSDVINTKGYKTFLSLTEWLSVCASTFFILFLFLLILLLDAGCAGTYSADAGRLPLLAIHQEFPADGRSVHGAHTASLLRLASHPISPCLRALLFGIGIYREIAHAERGEVLGRSGRPLGIDVVLQRPTSTMTRAAPICGHLTGTPRYDHSIPAARTYQHIILAICQELAGRCARYHRLHRSCSSPRNGHRTSHTPHR